MAVCKVASSALLLIFILNLVKSDEFYGFCETLGLMRLESLKDLYNYNGSSDVINIIPTVNRSNFQELRQIHIPNAAAIKVLGLRSVINNFKSEDFKDLVNLTVLCMNDNKLHNISKRMFDGLKIRRLHLDHCHINNIETGVFAGLSKIGSLSLMGNNIPNIKRGIFNNLAHLEFLQLTDNRITNIETGAFAGLSEIFHLSVIGNNIPNIKKGIFNNLTHLHTFVLRENRITNIENGAFEDLPNLTILSLGGNFFKKIFFQDYFTFEYLPKLHKIGIGHGNISEISAYMLEGLTNLEYLFLSSNKISFIEPLAFEKTLKLKQLSLSNNKLQELDGYIFPRKGLPFLKHIRLDYNHLSFLSTTFLYKLKGLKSISIVGNPWQCKCLDQVLIWMDTWNVSSECDQSFFDGSRPVCVVPENGSSCVYNNDPELNKYFQNVSSFYNKTDNCS